LCLIRLIFIIACSHLSNV